MMKMIKHENKVDIFNFVLNMRHQRNLMVQTEVSAINDIICNKTLMLGEDQMFFVHTCHVQDQSGFNAIHFSIAKTLNVQN